MSELERLEFMRSINKSSSMAREAARKKERNKLKRTVGVTVPPRPTPATAPNPYDRSQEQVENYWDNVHRRQFPDD